jgi:ABC-type multidrug transport system fused ATPase/permease subunit
MLSAVSHTTFPFRGEHLSSNAAAAYSPGLVRLFRAFWRYAEGKRYSSVFSSALLVASQLVKLCVPWLAAQAMNTIQTSGVGNLQHAGWLMVGIVAASVLSWALHGPGRIIERSVGIEVRSNLADGIYARLSRLPLAWHETHHSGETVHRVDKTTAALYDFAQNQFIYLQNIVNMTGPIVALALISAATGTLALAGYLLVGYVIVRFDRVLVRLVESENHAQRRYAAALVDCLGNISTVLSLRLQQATRRLLRERLAQVFVPVKRNIVVNEAKWCAVDLLTIGLTWSLVALYAWLAQENGTLLLGNVFMVYTYANQAGGVIVSLAAHYGHFSRMQADFASADPIWRADERRIEDHRLPADWRTIEVRNLAFRYVRGGESIPTLVDVNLAFRRGEKIALVGASGAGKSTLMRVLAGLYDPQTATLCIDGRPNTRVKHLGELATLIPQDAEVFEGSVRDNITFGLDYPAEMLREAICIAGFEPVIASLPQGLDTVISERGLNLSGGQKQRMALARGVLAASRSSLLLLDEPTSSLDAVTEARVFTGLRAAFPDACIVSSVHRLNLLPRFNRIVLMAEGKIADSGTVDELVRRSPLFRELWHRSTGESAA